MRKMKRPKTPQMMPTASSGKIKANKRSGDPVRCVRVSNKKWGHILWICGLRSDAPTSKVFKVVFELLDEYDKLWIRHEALKKQLDEYRMRHPKKTRIQGPVYKPMPPVYKK